MRVKRHQTGSCAATFFRCRQMNKSITFHTLTFQPEADPVKVISVVIGSIYSLPAPEERSAANFQSWCRFTRISNFSSFPAHPMNRRRIERALNAQRKRSNICKGFPSVWLFEDCFFTVTGVSASNPALEVIGRRRTGMRIQAP